MNIKRFFSSSPTYELYGFRPINASGGFEYTKMIDNVLYKIHLFTDVGTSYFIVKDSGSDGKIDYLVVGGGGGGGMDMGGGGGAGGVLSGQTGIKNGTFPVVVGRGGYGAPGGSLRRTDGVGPQPGAHQFTVSATNGENSSFLNMIAYGGGYGGSSFFDYTPNLGVGGNGASGGGTSGYSNGATVKAGGTGIAGQGNRGGQGGPQYYSGGGGGAGAAGTDATSQPNGGIGVVNSILGYPMYWGGGGGGAAYSAGSGGNGGRGGGGGGAVGTSFGGDGFNPGNAGYGGSNNAQTNTRGGSGGANTGGGGGGGSHYNANNSGGDGGSGIVIIRYPINFQYPNLVPSGVVSNGLTLYLDASLSDSYPGSGTTWYDLSGNGNDFTMGGTLSYNSIQGFSGFSQTNRWYKNGFPNSLKTSQGGNGYTTIVWAKNNAATASWQKLIGNGDAENYIDVYANPTNGFYTCEDGSSLFYNNAISVASGTFQLGNNTWRQLASTNVNSGTLNGPWRAFGIGSEGDASAAYGWNGNIAVVMIYNRILSSSEITENYNFFRSRFGV